jgi:hypothetical protein
MAYFPTNYVALAEEDIAVGDVVRLDSTPGVNAGKALKAQATSTAYGAMGVAVSAATAGNRVQSASTGTVAVRMDVVPATISNGAKVYLSPTTAGRGTLTLPTASGEAIVILGRLSGADGATTSPGVVLEISFVAIFG